MFMPNELHVLRGSQNEHCPPPHTLPLISIDTQRLKSPFCGGQVGIGVGTTTGLRVGTLVGAWLGSFVGRTVGSSVGISVGIIVGNRGAGVGIVDGVSVITRDGAVDGPAVG
jgi:hypothetical protein